MHNMSCMWMFAILQQDTTTSTMGKLTGMHSLSMCIHFMSTVANRPIGQAAVDQLKSPALKSAITQALSRKD